MVWTTTFSARMLLFACLLFVLLDSGVGLRCYRCDSKMERACGFPFHARPELLATCKVTVKPAYCVLVHYHNTSRVQRGCDSSLTLKLPWQMGETRVESEAKDSGMECVTDFITPSFQRVTQCRCTKPGCNPAPRSCPSLLTLALTLAAALGAGCLPGGAL